MNPEISILENPVNNVFNQNLWKLVKLKYVLQFYFCKDCRDTGCKKTRPCSLVEIKKHPDVFLPNCTVDIAL